MRVLVAGNGGPLAEALARTLSGTSDVGVIDAANAPGWSLFHIVVADLPHGRFSNEKTKRLLGWEPRDRLEQQ